MLRGEGEGEALRRLAASAWVRGRRAGLVADHASDLDALCREQLGGEEAFNALSPIEKVTRLAAVICLTDQHPQRAKMMETYRDTRGAVMYELLADTERLRRAEQAKAAAPHVAPSRLRRWAPALAAAAAPAEIVELPTGWDRNDMFVAEMRHFLECLEQGRAPEPGLAAGIAAGIAEGTTRATLAFAEQGIEVIGAHLDC